MKFFNYILTLTVLFSAINSRAECPSIDMLSKPPLADRQSLFQADLSWCCSYAFVDGLSLKYNKNYSPIDIAISKMKMSQKLEDCDQLSQIPEAINQSTGLCLESEFESAVYNEPELVKILDKIQDIFKNSGSVEADKHSQELIDAMAKSKYRNRLDDLKKQLQSLDRANNWQSACSDESPFNTKIFKNLNSIKDLAQIARLSLDKSFFDFMYNLSQKNCKSRDKVRLEYTKIELNDINADPAKEIIDLLLANKSPVFGINEDNLFKIEHSFFEKLSSSLVGNHAVNVVGSRAINGKCFLKIRDSSYGGPICNKNKLKNENVLCSDDSETANKMTYEVEIKTFLKAARQGLVLK